MIISRAPLRISFFGGGTDYPNFFLNEGGAVLASAIDKYSYVTASAFPSHLFDYLVRVSYRKVELAKNVDDIEHSVYRECLKYCGLERNIELHNVADLPSFTGLGSSSAFTVSLLQALHAFKGEFLTPMQLAYEAIYIEQQVLHDPVGCQDQVLSAIGGFNFIEFRGQNDIEFQRVPISLKRLKEFEQNLVIIYSGITRRAADIVNQQLSNLSNNLETLRCMRSMARQGMEILTNNHALAEFGELLHEAWLAKRSLDSCISKPEIDELYENGLKAGALGGKLLGAGGGGFVLFYVPEVNQNRFQNLISKYQLLKVRLNAPGSQIIFAG